MLACHGNPSALGASPSARCCTQNGTSAMALLVSVSALHARGREALVLQRLHTGWCPRRCFTAAMADSLRQVASTSVLLLKRRVQHGSAAAAVHKGQ